MHDLERADVVERAKVAHAPRLVGVEVDLVAAEGRHPGRGGDGAQDRVAEVAVQLHALEEQDLERRLGEALDDAGEGGLLLGELVLVVEVEQLVVVGRQVGHGEGDDGEGLLLVGAGAEEGLEGAHVALLAVGARAEDAVGDKVDRAPDEGLAHRVEEAARGREVEELARGPARERGRGVTLVD